MFLAGLGASLFAQAPDTTTLEKKAVYYSGQIKDNKVRAITPLMLRKAFNAVKNLALATVIPDTSTHPAVDLVPSDFDEGIGMFQIREADGWQFDGTLLVEKSADGHAIQTATAATTIYPDQRKRVSYPGQDGWTRWNAYSAIANVDLPDMPVGGSFTVIIDVLQINREWIIKRLVYNGDLDGLLMYKGNTHEGQVSVMFQNTTAAAIDPGPATIEVLVAN